MVGTRLKIKEKKKKKEKRRKSGTWHQVQYGIWENGVSRPLQNQQPPYGPGRSSHCAGGGESAPQPPWKHVSASPGEKTAPSKPPAPAARLDCADDQKGSPTWPDSVPHHRITFSPGP